MLIALVPPASKTRDLRPSLPEETKFDFARAGLSFVKASGGKLTAPIGKGARVASREIGGLRKDGWKGFLKSFPKGVESGARKVGHAMIVGGAAALMAHLAAPLAALGTLVSSFAPLGKIAKEWSGGDDDENASDDKPITENGGEASV